MTQRPVPEWKELEQVAWDAMQDGRLIFQCDYFGAWLPPQEESPFTLSREWEWAEASGRGYLVSWVTYHIAYHDYFKDKVPYEVGIIELEEGPRLLAGVEFGNTVPAVDMQMQLSISRDDDGIAVPVFQPHDDQSSDSVASIGKVSK